MLIQTDKKTIKIPNWALFVGAMVVDNIVCNICKTVSNKPILKKEK